MAKIVLFGASGMVGRRVLREALERGHSVTAVARDTARIEDRADRLTIESGDVTDPATVVRLARGADVVVSAVTDHTLGSGLAAYAATCVGSLLTGLRELGDDAPRLVMVGGAGSLEVAPGVRLVDSPDFPGVYRHEALAFSEVLETLRGVTDVSWTVLSPAAAIAPGERTGVFRLGGDRLLADDAGNSSISAEDYAVAMVDEIENPKHVRGRFTVAY